MGCLQGVECQQCHRFYAALESWGTIGQERVRLECGHVQQGEWASSPPCSTASCLDRLLSLIWCCTFHNCTSAR
jgi:hypothetical protein